jgi:deoxyribonuclease-4
MTRKLGAHVSTSGGAHKAIQRQADIGGNCGQIFAGSPRTWTVASYTDEEGNEFKQLRNDAGQGPYVIHSTYLVNLATPKDELFAKSIQCLQDELNAAATLGVDYVVFHPGAHTGSGKDNGIERIAEGIDRLDIPDNVTLLLENTAGKGTTLGKKMADLKQMIDLANATNLGVCIDTCHAHAAGYDLVNDFNTFIDEIETDLGLDLLKVLHLNDSKDPKGSEKDNHEHIGEGTIGNDGFRNVVTAPAFHDIPMILETPVTDDKGYQENIKQIRTLMT